MGRLDLEALAADFRSRAGVGGNDSELAANIAAAVIGRHAVRVVSRMTTPATIVWVDGEPRIYLREDARDRNHLIAHECGHLALRWAGYSGPRDEEERHANYIGAAIIAPPLAVERAAAWFGEDLARVAECFYVTQTSAALRLGEVRGERWAVVTKTDRVLERNFPEPNLDTIRSWARTMAPRGMKRKKLTGSYDRGRIAIKAK